MKLPFKLFSLLTLCLHFKRSAGRIALAVGALSIAASCSFVGAAYQNATTLIVFEIDSYLDLTDAQSEAGKVRTDELMAWHRRDVLPLYVKQIRAVAGQVEQGFDTAQVAATFDWGMGELRRVNLYGANQQVELLTSLSDKQISYLQKKLVKDNAKYRKEWLDPPRADMLELRFDKFLTNMERFYGSFNSEQKNQIRTLSNARLWDAKIAYEQRLARQTAFVGMVKNLPRIDTRSDTKAAAAQINAFIAGLEKPSEYAATNRKELLQLIASVSQIATPAQRLAAKTTLLDYANTFEGLSRGR